MLKVRGKNVAVEKIKKSAKKSGDAGWLSTPESDEYVGVIRYVGDEVKDLEVGQRVYFGTNLQEFSVRELKLCLMIESNVLAVISEEPQAT